MRGPRLLALAALFCLVVAGFFSLPGITLDDDALDLLPGEAVQGDLRLLQRLGLIDRVFLTLTVKEEGLTAAQRLQRLQQSALVVGEAFADSGAFTEVIYRLPQGYEFGLYRELWPHIPALLNGQDLAALAQRTSNSGLAARLAAAFNLLNSPAGIALKRQVQQDPLGIAGLALAKLRHLQAEYTMVVQDGFFISEDGRSCLIMAESRTSLTDSNSALQVEKVVQDALALVAEEVEGGVIGSLPHTLANARAIQRDLRILLPIASLLLLLLLLVSLRDGRAFVVLGIPFLAAPFAIGVVDLVFGRISALALGFGIVLLGIAVDFSVHIYLALRRRQQSTAQVMAGLRRPLLLATLTTSGVFVVLFFSQVASHQQMALLALVGVVLAVSMSWVIIPLVRPPRHPSPLDRGWSLMPPAGKKRALVLLGWLLLMGLGGLSWPALHYNGDLRVLDAPDEEVLAQEEEFHRSWGRPGDQAFVVASAPSLAAALEKNSALYAFLQEQQVSRFQSLAPLLPGPVTQQAHLEAWQQFWEQRPDFHRRFAEAARKQGFNPQGFQPFFEWLDHPFSPLTADDLLAGPLAPLARNMIRAPGPQAKGADGEFLVVTTVTMEEGLYDLLLAFSEQQEGVYLLANHKWRQQVEQLLRRDILTLSLAAGLIILLIVSLALRRVRPVVGALAPVGSALASMAIYSLVSGGELNMMHLLMGIMVIGLSVDYGIFMVCRGREIASMQAISICACSSLIGFGVLAFAAHPALHALGITVLVGIGAAWPTALLVTPILAGEKS
ncbi:MAG: hypothetical protein RI601_07615 [Desulfurivibrionaceae bacterium]|nr:hypothetical protein [Desulfurivibrionaceae bacterium]